MSVLLALRRGKCLFLPCKQISGDFYDLTQRTEDVFSLAIGDVVGKGISGALIMSNFYATYLNEAVKGLPLASLMTNLNAYLTSGTELNAQITLFLAKMDVDEGVFRYVNAGHPAPLIFHKDGSMDRLETGGPLLGFDETFTYAMDEIKLAAGDLIILFTDGVTDIVNKSGQLFDESGLITYIRTHLDRSVEEITKGLVENLDSFNRQSGFEDDLTFIIGRYTGTDAHEFDG